MTALRRTGLLAPLLLAACSLGPNYKRPATEIPPAFRATMASATKAWPAPGWWQGFGSPELDRLIAEARTHNQDLAVAVAQVRQADAQVRIAGSPLLPTLSGNAGASWQQVGTNSSSGSFKGSSVGGSAERDVRSYSLGLDVSYELDFWGKNRALYQSAKASAIGSRFDQQVVALTVVSSVATTYFTALALKDRLAIARHNLADAESTLAVIQGRLAAGTATALDLAQEESLVAGERANIPALQSQLDQEVIGLGILVGRPPEDITVTADTLTNLPTPEVTPGLPSQLLARRPDVAYAEAQLVAQNGNVRAARAAFFPAVSLSGSAGWNSFSLSSLFGPGAFAASIAGSVVQTIFDNGNLQGQYALQKGIYDQLVAQYRKSVLQAFTDVENAITAYRYATSQEKLERQAVATAQRAANIARAQLAAGTVDVTTVLTAQATLYGDEDALAQIRLARFIALVDLYKALGGGWQEPTTPIPGAA